MSQPAEPQPFESQPSGSQPASGSQPTGGQPAKAAVPAWHRLIGAVGLLGHLGLLVFYAGSGLVAPGWAVIVLMIVWLALLVLGIRLLITRPLLALLVPVVAALFWYAAISAGDAFLNWTA